MYHCTHLRMQIDNMTSYYSVQDLRSNMQAEDWRRYYPVGFVVVNVGLSGKSCSHLHSYTVMEYVKSEHVSNLK